MTLDIRLSGRNSRAQHFLDRCSRKFGDRFDYSNFEYVNAKTPSEIICRTHGPFLQSPDKHIHSTHACPGCNSDNVSRVHKGKVYYQKPNLPLEEYLERLNLPGSLSINTEDYIGLTKGSVVLTCPSHGVSTYTPQALLINQYKCASCGRDAAQVSKTKSFEEFVSDATKLYGGKYTYPQQPYTNRRGSVVIICPVHGEFTKKVHKHLSGQECYACTFSEGVLAGRYTGGYSTQFFTDNPKMSNQPATIYYMKIGDLYKIGITIREISNRVKCLKYQSKKSVEVIDTHETTLLGAYTLEQRILGENSAHRVYRTWSTELFDIDVLPHTPLKELER